MKACRQPGCGRPVNTRGWCGRHYKRWLKHGNPEVVLPPGTKPMNDLPNPWAEEAPPCPHGCSSEQVYLWADEGTLRWLCVNHGLRFDATAA